MEQQMMAQASGFVDSAFSILNSVNEFMGFEIQLLVPTVVVVAILSKLVVQKQKRFQINHEVFDLIAALLLGFVLQAALITYDGRKDMFKSALQLGSVAVLVQYFVVPRAVQFVHWLVDTCIQFVKNRFSKTTDAGDDNVGRER